MRRYARAVRLAAIAPASVLAVAVLAGTPVARAAVPNPHNVMPCTKCHLGTPSFGVDTLATVGFTTGIGDPGLCAPCHEPGRNLHPVGVAPGTGPDGARVSWHLRPGGAAGTDADVGCVSCHFVHASDGRHGLLRGFPGSPDPRAYPTWQSFCRECHGENLRGRSPHGGGETACGFCHPARPEPGRRPEVVARDGGVCRLCHEDWRASHGEYLDQRGGELRCAACHDAHADADERPGLLVDAFLERVAEDPTVRPHYRRGLCVACHANLDDFELRAEGVNATCDRCHASGRIRANIHPLRPVPAEITVPGGWPLEGGALTCLTCHEQGHDDQEPRPGMLRGGPYEDSRAVCRGCHAGHSVLASTIHADINEGRGCDLCHRTTPVPGRDAADDVDFIADPDLLCLRCHDLGEPIRGHHRLDAGGDLGGDDAARGLPLYRGRVICGSCHNPHQLEPDGYRLRGELAALGFCTGCHEL